MPNPPEQGDELLRMYLERQDSPCPSCGYNLRGLKGDRCPECSQGLALRVNLTEPRMGWWVAGLVGLAAGAGFSGLLTGYALIAMDSIGSLEWIFLRVTGVGLAVEGAMLALWVATGRALRRRRGLALRILAIGCWALTLLNLVVFARVIQ